MKRERSRSPLSNRDDDDDDCDGDNRRMDRKKFDRTRGSSKKVPSDCRIYVSNIPYEYKWQDLKDLFRNEVGDVAYVEMFNDDSGRPRGCAIVDFESHDMARKAIDKMHRYEAKGRKLIVKEKDEVMNSRDFSFLFHGNHHSNRDRGRFSRDADRSRSFERTPMPDLGPGRFGNTYGLSIAFLESIGINGPLVNKVFVANLDYKVTDEDLKELFKVAGKVTEAEVIKDLDGKSRGFGVVEYEHPVQAVQSISMLHNQIYCDRKLSVRMDRASDKQKDQKANSKLPPGLKGLGMGLGINGEAILDLNNVAAAVNSQNQSMPGSSMLNMPAGNMESGSQGINPVQMLGMSGIDPSSNPLAGAMGAVASNLSSALGIGMGQNMMNVGGLNHPNAMPSGMPNNAFGSPGLNMGGPNQVSSGGPGMGNPSYGGNSFQSGGSNSRDFSSSSSSNSYGLRSVVQISNLPLDYTWQNLRDLCRDYGDIRFAEMRSKGVGLIRFSSETGARRAADLLDRQRFDGRVLDARIL